MAGNDLAKELPGQPGVRAGDVQMMQGKMPAVDTYHATPLDSADAPIDRRKHAVHKWVLSDVRLSEISAEDAADVIHVGIEDGKVCVWVLIDVSRKPYPKQILRITDGERFDRFEGLSGWAPKDLSGWTPIGSVTVEGASGSYTHHFFWS